MRKTKIVCTLGPATNSKEVLREIILAGMNVARFNFSHGSYEEHKERFDMLCTLREELQIPVATMLDTKGPEIRLCKFKDGAVKLQSGNTFILTTEDIVGDEKRVSITYKNLPNDLRAGDTVLIDDGLLELSVHHIEGTEIHCNIITGGKVSDNKGVNVPGVCISMPYISDKDRSDLLFGVKTGFDFIAASFVRQASDVLEIRKILNDAGCKTIKIIAKIESEDGVKNIDEILKVADGIMVARGDMGVEIPFTDVPVLQKKLIKKCARCGKYVITATQMLDSMMQNPRPTRAEATDVANAIYDGSSAIMLSGETAAGKYPVEAVKVMAAIALRAEQDIDYRSRFYKRDDYDVADVTNAISHATCATAYDLSAAAIVTVTRSGQTARMISKYRPSVPILGCATDEYVYRQLCMSWGVIPVLCEMQESTDSLILHAVDKAQKLSYVKTGDLVVVTAGVPLGIPGTTNLLKVHIVGDVLVTGKGINEFAACGGACVARNADEARLRFKDGNILVIPQTSNDILDLLKKASGIITEQDGPDSHAAVVGLSLDIPVIVGAAHCATILKNGTAIRMDAKKGIVCNADCK